MINTLVIQCFLFTPVVRLVIFLLTDSTHFGQGGLGRDHSLSFNLFLQFTRKLQIGKTNLGTAISEEIAEICFFWNLWATPEPAQVGSICALNNGLAAVTQGSCFPSNFSWTGFSFAVGLPHSKMHLVLLFSGLGSVENCRLYLTANLSKVSSIICMASLVGARRSKSSQKHKRSSSTYPANNAVDRMEPCLVPLTILNLLDLVLPHLTQAYWFSYTLIITMYRVSCIYFLDFSSH